MNPSEIKNILIMRFSSMGDLILMSPLVESLREEFPQANITLVTRSDMAAIYKHHTAITRIESVQRSEGFKGLVRMYQKLRQTKWDMVYDAHGSLRSLFLRFLLRAQVTLVIDKRTLQRLLLVLLKWNALPFVYFKDQYLLPLSKFLNKKIAPRPTRIHLSTSEENAVNACWTFHPHEKVVGIVPSAQWPGKRWPLQSFIELAQELLKESSVAIFGGPNDTFCEAFNHFQTTNDGSKKLINLQGRLGLLETFEALKRCHLVIANDTGLMHAAEAVGTDVIALLGPTGEEFGFVPFRPTSRVLSQKMWCRPCSKNGQGFCIRFGKRTCLTGLSVESVLASSKNYLNQRMNHAPSLAP